MDMERYELPEGWEWKRVGDKAVLIDIQPGFACGKKDVVDGIPHLRMNNISKDGLLNMSLVRRIPKDKAEKAGKWLELGDVIFNNTNSTELVGKTCIFLGWKERCTFSNHLTRLRCNASVLTSKWLYVCLREIWLSGYFAANCVEFVGQSAFNVNKLKELEISIPPLPEQRRIVKRIEELTRRVEESRKLRTANLEDISRLLPSAMETCFQDDDGWFEKPLNELCVMKTGKTPPTSHPEYFNGDIPFVCPADVGERLLISDAQRRLSIKAIEDRKATVFEKGAVLLVCIGSTVGKVGLAARRLCTNQQITGLVFNNGVLPEYAAWFLTQQRETVRNAAAGGGVPIINQNGVGQLSMRFPEDKAEQRRIVEYLNGLQSKAEELKQLQSETEAELAAFTPALLAKAFRGEL